MGLRWCSGQTTRLSPLRFRVRSPVSWTRTQSSFEKSKVNALPKVVGFLPQGKLTGWDRYYGPTVIGSRCCGDPALVAKLNKQKKNKQKKNVQNRVKQCFVCGIVLGCQ